MKKASPVWESFEKVDDKQVQCKFIALTLSYRGGTTSMLFNCLVFLNKNLQSKMPFCKVYALHAFHSFIYSNRIDFLQRDLTLAIKESIYDTIIHSFSVWSHTLATP